MKLVLGENRYGKSRVRLMKVTRGGPHDRVDEWTVEVWLEGDFKACFEEGDNSGVLPTDTMKNTVYSLARASSAVAMEDFAIELARHFIETNPNAQLAGVRIASTAWMPIVVSGRQFATAFTHGAGGNDSTTVTYTRVGRFAVTSGFEDLWLLKTAGSAFAGFMKDKLTTLKETHDRLFGTLAKAEWLYVEQAVLSGSFDFTGARGLMQNALISTFAAHESLSVQQTLYAMAEASLRAVEAVDEINLLMPNKHCNLVDLSAFGQDNPNIVFMPTDEPHGSIAARVGRSG